MVFKTPDRSYSSICRATDGLAEDSKLDGGWSRFGVCSRACSVGTQSRTCSNPAPANGGKGCEGNLTRPCSVLPCAGKDVQGVLMVVVVVVMTKVRWLCGIITPSADVR